MENQNPQRQSGVSLLRKGQLAIPETIAEEPFEGVQVLLTLNRDIQYKFFLYISV